MCVIDGGHYKKYLHGFNHVMGKTRPYLMLRRLSEPLCCDACKISCRELIGKHTVIASPHWGRFSIELPYNVLEKQQESCGLLEPIKPIVSSVWIVLILMVLCILTLQQSKPWWRLRTIVHCPFVASQRRRLNWVQLAGHKGNFKAAEEGTILKKLSENEKLCFERMAGDTLLPFIPGYHGVVEREGELFLHMTDLLVNFDLPNVMDCKMGVRTYLEEELVRAGERPKMRRDLYDKMVEVDYDSPTPEEHLQKAVTKPRYMQWRETLSSTHTLGFRIEGIKKADGTCKTNFKKTRSKEDVTQVFRDFVEGNTNITNSYLRKLSEIQEALKMSRFFTKHEVIGSSLLFIHDHTERAQVWLIDFGKTTALPEGQRLFHNVPWQEGNREDGYLWGLDNLMHTLGTIVSEGPHQPENE